MVRFLVLLPLLWLVVHGHAQSSSPAVRYSELLLFALRNKQPTLQLQRELQQYPIIDLQTELKEDKFKKAFWINIYNAFAQIKLGENKDLTVVQQRIFNEKFIPIAGRVYRLSIIENEFLRPGKKGLQRGDYRIHFALNKGAESSPAIIVFDSENIESLLDMATKLYLKAQVHMDEEGFEVEVPQILKKYSVDFGGKNKIIELLRRNEVVYMNVTPKLEYKKYDWKLKLDNFLPADEIKK